MIIWGLVSAATMFAHDMWTFYALHILLGIAEAGFFPRGSFVQIGLLAARRTSAAIIAMTVVGTSSDRHGERRWHLAGSALAAAIGWSLVGWPRS